MTKTMDEDSSDVGLDISTPTDADGDSLTITVTGLPTGGTLYTADGDEVTNGMTLSISQLTGLIFTPDANLNDDNTDFGSFTYSVSDGSTSTSGTVNISVTPVNDAPEFNSGPDLNIEEIVLRLMVLLQQISMVILSLILLVEARISLSSL